MRETELWGKREKKRKSLPGSSEATDSVEPHRYPRVRTVLEENSAAYCSVFINICSSQ